MKTSISRQEFHRRAKQGNLIPVFSEILGDTLTPISIFLKMGGDRAENSFLLESVINNEKLGRNSFLGVNARAVLRGQKGKFTLSHPGKSEKDISFEGDPLAFLEKQFKGIKAVADPSLPAFYGGAVGFLSYDAIRYYENIPDKNPDPIGQEDIYLVFADDLVMVDHVERNVRLVANVRLDEYPDIDTAYDGALARLDAMIQRLRQPIEETRPTSVSGKMEITSNMTEHEYRAIVARAKEYIFAGDIFQVVLSKRFSCRPEVHPFQIYRALRSINPSPYMYYLNAGPYRIVGSSPEILVQVQKGKVTLRPIAGTRRRGGTVEQDLALEKELLADQKEIAEHIMLVDLGRNDVGRVSVPGSVRVTEFKTIERYSHVMHIVSNVEGNLREDLSPYDALRAALHAGTVTGAPKIRSMEIIDELENVRRGIYAGCIGYFNFDGEFDTAIAIRTMVIKNDVCHLQAGAGVVFDSDPVKECEEVANKVRALFAAVRFARRGLR